MEGEKEKMQEGRGRDVGLEAGPDHGEPSQPQSRGKRPAGGARRGRFALPRGSRPGGAGGGADARVSGTERGPGHRPSRGDRGAKTTRRGQDSVSTRAAKRPST